MGKQQTLSEQNSHNRGRLLIALTCVKIPASNLTFAFVWHMLKHGMGEPWSGECVFFFVFLRVYILILQINGQSHRNAISNLNFRKKCVDRLTSSRGRGCV